ncbi:MAG: HlyC/CorC family transporter [Caldilineae bacterium]|nr:MAG: HlyC/CorC family transporter [Caldilineae bacterium]
MVWLVIVLIIIFLILANALFVAAEIAAVGVRRSRLAQLAEEGNRLARLLVPIVEDPHGLDNYIAACQLGITLSSLILGFYGQAAITPYVAPVLEEVAGLPSVAAASLAATGILLILTLLQILLGELAPKAIGIQYPERTAILTVLPVRWSMVLLRPLIWFFNGSGRLLLGLFGIPAVGEGAHVHAPEEILMLVQESGAGGLLAGEEKRLLENTLLLRERPIRQVMVPRTNLMAAPVEIGCADLLALVARSPYSRLPLYEGSIDNIVGVVHLKDLLCVQASGEPCDVQTIMRKPPYMPETLSAEEAFVRLQKEHYHMAVVIDEYGGTAGIVTFEDLIEEIFGDIRDEFDTGAADVQLLSGEGLLVSGDILVEELNHLLDADLPEEDVDTIGGLVQTELGRVPRPGDGVRVDKLLFQVVEMDGNHITRVRIPLEPDQIQQVKERLQ